MAPTATVSTASATQRLAGARRPSASRRARCVGVVAALPPNLRHRLFCRPHPSLFPLLKFNTTRAPRIRSGSTRVTATVADVATQNVYTFGKGKGQGDASMKALLGGKGANLAEMCAIGLSVPPGMTITTETCAAFHANGSKLPEGVWEEVLAGLAEVETEMGTKLGDAANPLLLSVRSGAAVSMPGMMDTVLNLGLNDTVVEGLAAKAGERFAYDSYRRFLDMFGAVVMGLPHEAFETELESLKASRGVSEDTDLSSDDLRELVELYKGVYSARGVAFPQEPLEQLRAGIYAVFDSWMSERANVYRRINGITGLKGTAVNVQAMAYGNLGDTSGTGVCFTRNPSTGEAVLYGEYLINAQGEDVVAGIRTPEPIARLAADLPEAYAELVANCNLLEAHYKDMQDIEFTVQEGRLFMLQCRSGKRTGAGAVRIAVDMVAEGLVSREEAVCMVEPTHVDQLLHPRFEDEAAYQADVIGKGLPASPGATTGVVVFRAEDAESMHAAGQDAILVRTETSPEDVGGMWAAAGVLTARGGMTSHAAVVARGWGKTCVSGCGELSVDETARTASLGGVTIREGDWLSLNGSTGEVIAGGTVRACENISSAYAQHMWPGTEAGGSREVMEARLRAPLLPGRPPPASSEQSTLGAGSPRDNGAVVAVPVLLQRSAESSSSLHDIHNYLLSDEDSGDNLMEGAGPLPDGRKATLAQSSLNLFNSIVGAGEMALPVSFSVLGIAGGSLALLLISAIMSDSIFTLVRVSVLRRQTTYGDVVGVYLGRWGAALVRVSLILTCLGFLISYTIIYGDLLVGDNQEGLLPSWMGHEKGPLPWYLHKQLVVGISVAFLVFPLTCLRSLERLASASLFKFIISLAYTAATVLTLVAAVRSDAYKPVRFWPDIAAFSAAPVSQITKLVAVLPVVLTAYSCHFNVHPLMHELENFTEGRMMTVVHTGLQTSTLVFAVVGISGYVCFGDGVSADVLQNYTTEYLAPFFGHEYAMMVVGVLKLGYFALLVCTFPLLNWPFRENILELMGIKEADMGTPFFCGVSAVLVALVYCIATTVPTIWQALSLMGSTSAVMVIFIFPGAVQFLSARDRFDVRGNARHQWWQCRLREARGATLVILGVIVGTCGVYSALTDDRLSQSTTLFRGDWTMVAPLRSTQ